MSRPLPKTPEGRARSDRDRALPKCSCGNIAIMGEKMCGRCRAAEDRVLDEKEAMKAMFLEWMDERLRDLGLLK